MNVADYKNLVAADFDKKNERKNKYSNTKTEIDWLLFDSNAEAQRYTDLKNKMLSSARQPSFLFSSEIRYRPDFIVWGKEVGCWVEDVKGFSTKEFILKSKLRKNEYPGMELIIIRRD